MKTIKNFLKRKCSTIVTQIILVIVLTLATITSVSVLYDTQDNEQATILKALPKKQIPIDYRGSNADAGHVYYKNRATVYIASAKLKQATIKAESIWHKKHVFKFYNVKHKRDAQIIVYKSRKPAKSGALGTTITQDAIGRLRDPVPIYIDAGEVKREDVDLPKIIAHELGHAIGMPHSASRTSIMNGTATANTDQQSITNEDIRMYKNIYNSDLKHHPIVDRLEQMLHFKPED